MGAHDWRTGLIIRLHNANSPARSCRSTCLTSTRPINTIGSPIYEIVLRLSIPVWIERIMAMNRHDDGIDWEAPGYCTVFKPQTKDFSYSRNTPETCEACGKLRPSGEKPFMLCTGCKSDRYCVSVIDSPYGINFFAV